MASHYLVTCGPMISLSVSAKVHRSSRCLKFQALKILQRNLFRSRDRPGGVAVGGALDLGGVPVKVPSSPSPLITWVIVVRKTG